MPRRFTLDPQEDQEAYNYQPSQLSRRVKNKLTIEENDPRFTPQPLKQKIGFVPEEDEEDPDPYGYDEIINRYRKELGGEQPALAKYREAIQNTPQQQDYDLGKWGKVGAALAGFGAGYQDPAKGVAVAKSLREAPWQRALKQHETDVENLGTEAEFEQKDRAARMKGLDLELDTVKNRRTADREDMNIGSQIQRRQQQTKNELSRLGIDTRRLDWDIINGMSDNELATFVANETARHNQAGEKTAAFNANTSRGQLGVAQGNLGLGRDRFNFESGRKFDEEVQTNMFNRHMDETEEAGRNRRNLTSGANQGFLSPDIQNDAQDAAALEAYRTSPDLREEFFTTNEDGYVALKTDLTPQQLRDPRYMKLERDVARRADEILATKRPGGGLTRIQ